MLHPRQRQAITQRSLTLVAPFRPPPQTVQLPTPKRIQPLIPTYRPPRLLNADPPAATPNNHPYSTTQPPAADYTVAEKHARHDLPPQNGPSDGRPSPPPLSIPSGNAAVPGTGPHISSQFISSKAITRASPERRCRRCRQDICSTVRAWMVF